MLKSIADKIIFLLFVNINFVIIKSPLSFLELPRSIKINSLFNSGMRKQVSKANLFWLFRLLTTSRLVTLDYLLSTLFCLILSKNIILFNIYFKKLYENREKVTCHFFPYINFTNLLVPNLSAPSFINFSASSNDFTPPAAFIFSVLPFKLCLNNLISSKVAPLVENPVEVFI